MYRLVREGKLPCRVVCEGVGTREQADFLREAGCEEAQGFYFARPLPLEEYEALVYPEE